MSCAGCDDCPRGAWHLHVTVGSVLRNEFWSGSEYQQLELIRVLGYKDVCVRNLMPDGSDYNEIIPTINYVGSEAKATAKLFEMGAELLRVGFTIKRLKIEGDPMQVAAGRALYFEAHIKGFGKIDWRLPTSVNLKGEKIRTLRKKTLLDMQLQFDQWWDTTNGELDVRKHRIEACVLDTAPELDNAWMGIVA